MEALQFVVPTLFGLEGVAGEELRRMGLAQVHADTGRVFCTGSVSDIPRLNLGLRTGERVQICLGSFPASDFDALFEGVRALPWEDFIPRSGAFPVKGHSLNSTLRSVPACQSIVKKAVASRLGQKYGLSVLPEDGPLFQIQFFILKDAVTVTLDTTGSGLHKRGYRAVGVTAPLRETLAAGIVLLSRYHGKGSLCDPFCGSGTLVIEAALIALNRAPGLDRSFASQRWPWLPGEAWMAAAQEAMDKEYRGSYSLWGGDLDPQAVAIARSNAKKAGVDELVSFSVSDALSFHPRESAGTIVTNPPYGERLLEKEQAAALYTGFGKTFSALPEGWSLSLISSHTGFESSFGRTADKRRKLYNGMIKCDLFQYYSPRAHSRPG